MPAFKFSVPRRHLVWLVAALWACTLSYIVANYWTTVFSDGRAAGAFQKNLQAREAAFGSFLEDTLSLGRFLEGKATLEEIGRAADMPFAAFVYQTEEAGLQLRWWSTNRVVPAPYDVSAVSAGTLVRYGSGEYELLRGKKVLRGMQYTIIGLVQLRQQYIVENANLRVSFPGFSGLEQRMNLTDEPTAYAVRGVAGSVLAWLKPIDGSMPRGALMVQFLLQLSGLLLLAVFVYRVSSSISATVSAWKGLSFLLGCWLTGWLLVRYSEWFLSWQLLANAATTSGSDAQNVDLLRALFIDAAFLVLGGLYVSAYANHLYNAIAACSVRVRQVAALLAVSGVTMLHLWVVSRLIDIIGIQDVSIAEGSYAISNWAGVYGLIGIFLFVVGHMLFTRLAGYLAALYFEGAGLWMVFTQAISGLLALSLFISSTSVPLLLGSLFWYLIFFYTVYGYAASPQKPSFLQAANWLLVYAVSVGVLATALYGASLRNRAVEIGESLMQQNSRTVEYQVRIAAAGVKRVDWPGYFQAGQDPGRFGVIRDSVQQSLFSGYLQNFYTTIHIFSANGSEVAGNAESSLESLNNLLNIQSEATGFSGLGYLEESLYDFGYVFRHVVRNRQSGDVVGYVFVTTRPGKDAKTPVLPELFAQLRELAADLPRGFSYAWYKNGQLIEQYRNYPFVYKIPEERMQRTMHIHEQAGGNIEAWFNSGDGSTLVVAATRGYPVEFVSITTQLFGIFMLCALLVFLPKWIAYVFSSGPASFYLTGFTIQQRLRATILGLLSIAVIIIAVVTNRYFIAEYRAKNEAMLAGTIGRIATALQQSGNQPIDSTINATEADKWRSSIRQIADAEDAEAAVYNLHGELIASTQQALYDKGVLGPVMNPLCWHRLTVDNVFRYIGAERIGKLKYVSAYQPVLDESGRTAGFVEVPFYAAENVLRREISNFVVIVINIMAFVFLLSGFAAFYITGSITKSLNLIAERMQGLKLMASNERISWNRNDEIGALVQQYNKMVGQLEESARKLAQSERETAWREMARQVAHEIKNPLTPMKLSIQYLQKAIAGKDANVEAIMQRVAAGLVEQIDHLSRIAFDFSQFANLGTLHAEVFDIGEMLKRLAQLFAMQDAVNIQVHVASGMMVYADKTQLNRLFTNLLKNACEAKHPLREVSIEITGGVENQEVFAIVCDNGKGISQDVLERIFMPNFTTKTSGTGLGLAICKAIAENAGGRIKVRTQPDKGTCFQVSLPLHQA